MTITPCTLSDLDNLFWFYDQAIAYQKQVFNKNWLGFDREMVTKEIDDGRQFKILMDDRVACVFVITHNDPLIWKDLDKDSAVYLHRIVTHPEFRGNGFVSAIIDWARDFCKLNNRDYIRLDTWADNHRLIDYYKDCGFFFVRNTQLEDVAGLPAHYQWELALMEIRV
jgi:ribosomal protein S18 acetylase RimI-like enzyme